MEVAAMGEKVLDFLGEEGGDLFGRLLVGVSEEVVGVEFGYRLDSADLAEIV